MLKIGGTIISLNLKSKIMWFVFIWVILSCLIGIAGDRRVIGFWPVFLVSLLLSPLFGCILVLISKEKK